MLCPTDGVQDAPRLNRQPINTTLDFMFQNNELTLTEGYVYSNERSRNSKFAPIFVVGKNCPTRWGYYYDHRWHAKKCRLAGVFLNLQVLQSWHCLVSTPGLRLAPNLQPCVRDADSGLTVPCSGRSMAPVTGSKLLIQPCLIHVNTM